MFIYNSCVLIRYTGFFQNQNQNQNTLLILRVIPFRNSAPFSILYIVQIEQKHAITKIE